ncbi:hypothetical protein [Methylobacter luteus]|uniref:hypothetical protein n=1 Tax=Methylobacter luteus TaxID=415 RepID=UPI0003FEB2F9|nr:hypothetical protein [Methylobacter luteus]
MSKRVLGLDLSANAIGWALLEEMHGSSNRIIDLGCRIFSKALEEKAPSSKDAERRNAGLIRRILQRRARRKQRMLNYLLKLDLLPQELQTSSQPGAILNQIGNPYHLRAKALDQKLSRHELGRVILHLVHHGSLPRSRKTLLGDMVDDPDALAVLAELGEGEDHAERGKEEMAFKKDVEAIKDGYQRDGLPDAGRISVEAGPSRLQAQSSPWHAFAHG